MRRPTKHDCLSTLLEKGLNIEVVLDVGIQHDTPELRALFQDKKQYLFEPVEEFFPIIHENYKANDYELLRVAASDLNGTTHLAKRKVLSGMSVSHSTMVDKDETPQHEHLDVVETLRLDDFIRTRGLTRPFLVKVDVDGAELKVLRGMANAVDKIHCVIVEASRTFCFERYKCLEEFGYNLFDIVDICYYDGLFHQCDLVFVRREMLQEPRFNGWLKGPFDQTKWQHLTKVLK